MNLLQAFGKFLAMFIDDEEHIQRRTSKATSKHPPANNTPDEEHLFCDEEFYEEHDEFFD